MGVDQLRIRSLKELQEHISDLSMILRLSSLSKSSDWLQVAAGIKSVDYQWNRFDKTGINKFFANQPFNLLRFEILLARRSIFSTSLRESNHLNRTPFLFFAIII